MNSQLSLASITRPLTGILGRYHLTIFIVTAGVLLSAAIFALYLVLSDSSNIDESLRSQALIDNSFDADTIERIDQLRSTADASERPVELPSPLNNPFVE